MGVVCVGAHVCGAECVVPFVEGGHVLRMVGSGGRGGLPVCVVCVKGWTRMLHCGASGDHAAVKLLLHTGSRDTSGPITHTYTA